MRRLTLILCGLALGSAVRLAGQDKKAAPAVIPGPPVTTPVNLGVKPGATANLTLTGTKLTDVTGVWTSFGGQATVPDGQKDAAKLTVQVAVPAAAFGQYELRVATKQGLTNARTICVDDLPEVPETDANRSKGTPQAVPNPCIVAGVATAEASDFFRVPATAGVPLTLEVLGRRLGSPIDPLILVHDAAGRELAGLSADDTPGLQTDARLTFTPKTSADYVVEIRDTTTARGMRRALDRMNPTPLPRSFIERVMKYADWGQKRAVLKLYRASKSVGEDPPAVPESAKALPVCVIWGAEDPFIPVEFAEQQRRHFPRAEVHVLPDLGHRPFIDDVEAVRRPLVEFLRRQTGA